MSTRLLAPLALAFLVCFAGTSAAEDVLFGRHVTPLLHKLGCAAGQCHGAFAGKGSLRLALFASDPAADHANLRGPHGRRVDTLDPDRSLLLLKPTGRLPHGGGVRFAVDSPEYRMLRTWIAEGAAYQPDSEGRVVSLRLEPATLVAAPTGASPRVRAFARLDRGQELEVTALTRFESLNPAHATVTTLGEVSTGRAGQTHVLAHYCGQVAAATVLVPALDNQGSLCPPDVRADPVDRLIAARLEQLRIIPAPLCTDEEFIRRVHLDVIGQLPLPEEVRAFLLDQQPNKRERLIDRLLQHPLHAAVWASKLCDLTGADDRFIGNNVYQFHDWFRNKFERNIPWDQIARGVLCATAADGRTPEKIQEDMKRDAEERKKQQEAAKNKKPDAGVPMQPAMEPWRTGYATRNTLDVFHNNLIFKRELPDKRRIVDARKIALRVASTFLGTQLECAQCHKHPNDRWTQADFLSFAAAFAHVDFGPDPALKKKNVNLSGTHVTEKPMEAFLDPANSAPLPPRTLGGDVISVREGVDPREEVWKWLVGDGRMHFAKAMVNRVWAHYVGRGLVEPVDGFAAANPPCHSEVLDSLARDFIEHRYDLRYLHRRVLNMMVYQRSWRTNPTNSSDETGFSHRILRRLSAEQMLDAIAQVTGTPVSITKRYADVRAGTRAAELAISRVGGNDGYLLQIFGKPLRTQNCECERSGAASLSQVLYLYNDDQLQARLVDPRGRLASLLKEPDDSKVIEELYLLALARLPSQDERTRSLRHVTTSPNRAEGFQDILWALLNQDEFVVNH